MTIVTGVQTPQWESVYTVHKTHGKAGSELYSTYTGNDLEPWQTHILNKGCAVVPGGSWQSKVVAVSIPRQQGKTEILVARALLGLFILDEKFIVISAHEERTTMEIFRRIDNILQNSPDLMSYVKHISRANGKQGVELHNGGRLRFIARSKNAGRGFTADVLLLDEAQELSEETWAAILPTTAAVPNSQIWLFGTPPSPSANSHVFTYMRNSARQGNDSIYWAEWSADETDDFDDPAVWAKSNPALGFRVSLDTIKSFRASMSEDNFAREILGIWLSGRRQSVIPADWWEPLGNPDLQLDEDAPIWLAIDVSPARTVASVSLAQKVEDGFAVVLLERRTGVTWAADYVAGICSRRNVQVVAVDGGGASATLIDPLKSREVPVATLNTKDVTIACGQFYDAVVEERLVHQSDPALSASLGGAAKRSLMNAWAWTPKGDDDITPLVSSTYALWATAQTVAKPKVNRPKISHGYTTLG